MDDVLHIPAALRALPQWVNWTGVKMPIDAKTGAAASSTDPATWATVEQAIARDPGHLGFVFANRGLIFGLDLDGCVSPDGEIQPWALKIVNAFGTYTEFSPSGTGLKLWGLGVPTKTGHAKAEEIASFPRVAPKSPGIEIYKTGRYFAFTAEHYPDSPRELKECQDELEKLCTWGWPTVPTPIVEFKPSDSLEQRAEAYLKTIPPAISGQGGSTHTFKAAQAIVRGFGLSPERAYPMFAQWNLSCVPPWSEKDLRRKLEQARDKSQLPEGYLAEKDQTPAWDSDVDLQYILGIAEPAVVLSIVEAAADSDDEPEAESEHPGAFPLEALRPAGLLTDIVNFSLATANYPQPELSLAAAVSLLAALTGRKITDVFGTRTNAYILGLDLTGAGKDHPRLVNKDLLLRIGAQPMIGPERIGSHAGIIAHLANQPALLCQIDEMGKFLATCKDPKKAPHLYNVTTVMMQLYSSSKSLWVSDAYADVKRTKTIDQPHLVVYGTATPDSFWQNLSSENISDGLIGRLMAFEGRGYEVEMQEPAQTPPPETLLEPLRWWAEFKPNSGNLASEHPSPRLIPHTPEAKARFMGHIKAINERRRGEDPLRAALWSRSAEKVGKLAMIHAVSRTYCLPETITFEDVNWGILVVNWMTRRILMQCQDHVSENDIEARAKRMLQIIGNRRMSQNEITRRTQWMRPRERDDYLKNFVSCGLLEMEIVPTKGRPKVVYWRPKRTSKTTVNLPSIVNAKPNPFDTTAVSG